MQSGYIIPNLIIEILEKHIEKIDLTTTIFFFITFEQVSSLRM